MLPRSALGGVAVILTGLALVIAVFTALMDTAFFGVLIIAFLKG